MTRFALAQLRHRPWRIAALALGILAAAVGFVLLTGSARTSSIEVRGTLSRNFRGAYDILVRPRGSYTPLERERGLVRDNYLSGIYGGITRGQYAKIKRIPGVAVAAPIANIGTVFAHGVVAVPLARFITGARDQLLAVHFSWRAQRGLSHYPGGVVYVYATHRTVLVHAGTNAVGLPVCEGFGVSAPVDYTPFSPVNSTYFSCFAANRGSAHAHVEFAFDFPVSLAAIDPVQEAKLVHLDGAIVSGHYLRPTDRPHRVGARLEIPAISSSRTVVDEQLVATVQRLRLPAGVDAPRLLATGACKVAVVPCPPGETIAGPKTAYRFVTSLRPAASLSRTVFSAVTAYGRLFAAPGTYWTSTGVRYRRLGRTTLAPIPARNSEETWIDDFNGQTGYYDQPTDNRDVQFRRLIEHRGSNRFLGREIGEPAVRSVGRFDPQKLPGFSPLSRVPLETYYPPQLEPADGRTRKLLHGHTLTPSQNVGDYIAQPPLFLTSLADIGPFFQGDRFAPVSSRQKRAPISVVRVRVKGAVGLDTLSRERVKTVAQLIHDRTGLAVDVTTGSSPTPITIALPKGRYGRPALTMSEGWTRKGVAVAYLLALDRKDLALFALVLVVCAFFIGNGAFASVRARRSEIGTLLTFGWSPGELFRLVLGELALVGVVAGLIGAGIAALLVTVLDLHFALWRTSLVVPLAVLLALVAGSIPAWWASRGQPLDAIRPPVAGGRRGRRVRGIASMAAVDLGRLPGRTAVGAAGLVLGVAALTVLVAIERSFSGTLVGTVLGDAVSVQVRSADFAALGLTLALSALSAADVLYLNLRERQAELVTLRTLGWSDGEVRALIALEALVLAVGASVAGAAVGVAVGAFLGVGLVALLVAAALAAVVAGAAALFASLLPLVRLRGLSAPEVLAAE